MKTFMAIGGHVGDMELTCGCVLAAESLKGNKIITVALTAGERGNPPHLTQKDYRVQKVEEANTFAKMLGGEAIVLDYPDGELPDTKELRVEVANLIRKYRPDVIFTHWKNSMHKDHSACSRIVVDAQFFAGIDVGDLVKGERKYAPIYFCENWEDKVGFDPYILVNCSEGYDLWTQAISKHWFIMNSSSFKYYDYYTHLSYTRGCLARCKHAQAFDVVDHAKFSVRQNGFE